MFSAGFWAQSKVPASLGLRGDQEAQNTALSTGVDNHSQTPGEINKPQGSLANKGN